MSDLIDRLRHYETPEGGAALHPICDEAADAIERLTAEHNAQKSVLVNEWFIAGQQFRRDIARLTAEVAALREDAGKASAIRHRISEIAGGVEMYGAAQDHELLAKRLHGLCYELDAIDAARKEQP